jgi:hypothetical protein
VFGETVGMVKGDFHVEKKTLLHHAATSDDYDLFSKRRRLAAKKVGRSIKSLISGKEKKDDDVAYSQVPDTITM